MSRVLVVCDLCKSGEIIDMYENDVELSPQNGWKFIFLSDRERPNNHYKKTLNFSHLLCPNCVAKYMSGGM
jgi:hypothetical protein